MTNPSGLEILAGLMSSIRTKILIVTRHAHRDVTLRSIDNGLSEKGRLQAIALKNYFSEKYSRFKGEIFSSPKVRCIETLQPIAEPKILDLLNERQDAESQRDFVDRVDRFRLQWLSGETPETLICSHGDWIPSFFKLALGSNLDLRKGGLAEIQFENQTLKLVNLVQGFDIS